MTLMKRSASVPLHSLATFLLLVTFCIAETSRYRSGILQGDVLHELVETTVPEARNNCRELPSCVSFSFHSPTTRFPNGQIHAYFFEYADWHVNATTGEGSFIEDPAWHSYVNTTREREAISTELKVVVDQLKKTAATTKLRGRLSEASEDHKYLMLSSLFFIIFPNEHRLLAAPLVVRPILDLASSPAEHDHVRQEAMRLLIVLSDSTETGHVLFRAGVYQAMKAIVDNRVEWDETSTLALDVISNICLHRTANDQLRRVGAHKWLQNLVSQPGFPGVQAGLALTHIATDEDFQLPRDKLVIMVEILRNALDGDITYGIQWETIPGPLSAIKYISQHGPTDATLETLLDAGIMEQLLRVIQTDCLKAEDVTMAMEVIQIISTDSKRARQMALQASHALREAETRLKAYATAIEAAADVNTFLSSYEHSRAEL